MKTSASKEQTLNKQSFVFICSHFGSTRKQRKKWLLSNVYEISKAIFIPNVSVDCYARR